MADKFKPVNVEFPSEVLVQIEDYVEEQIKSLEQQHRELHDSKIPKWRKLYLGIPAEATRNFPFPNAANTVVQVIGETTDTMVARVMGLIYATHPLFPFKSYVKAKTAEEYKEREEMRRVVEEFMENVGIEPDELDLQLVEALWFTDACKLGTAFAKIGYEQSEEAAAVGYSEKKARFDVIEKEGPKVVKLRHEDVLVSPKAQTLEEADFIAVRHPMTRMQLESRSYDEVYDKKAVDGILDRPDRQGPRQAEREELKDQGIAPTSGLYDVVAEWDVYECYFPWWHNGKKFRLIYNYHKKTKTVLRKVYNFLPKNDLPIKRAKLGYRTDGMYGHGYAELLETYQEELSTTHNQRLDNATVANIRALRVSPRARALDSNVELYPSALIIGEKDDIEALQVGDVYPSTFKNEEMTLSLVARRAGISPAISGAGTGGVMKRPNVYSAQGTLAVMQENNSVVGFATSEFRHAHVILGSSLTALYGKFGTGGKEEMFGLDGTLLKKALKEFERNRMRIPIRASTGSLNKEVDKQTGMLMSGLMQRHYTAVSQVLQAVSNPMAPPELKDYLTGVVTASEMLHKRILKDFGYDQPDLYVPEAKLQQQQQPPQQNAGGGPPVGGGGGGAAGGSGANVPFGNVEGYLAGVAPAPGVGPR